MITSRRDTPGRSILSTLRLAALLGCAAVAVGCSSYRVVRMDESLRFSDGDRFVLLPSTGEAHDAALEEGFVEALRADAGDYVFEPGETVPEGDHGLRLFVRRLAHDGTHWRVEADVTVVDPSGEAPDEISMEVDVEADADRAALLALGREIGRRTSHFVHSREAHAY